MGAGDNKKVCCEAATDPQILGPEKRQHPIIGETNVFHVCETYNFSTIDVWNIKQKIGKLFLMASKIRDHPLATIKITIGEFLTPLPDSIFIFFMHNIILWEQGRHLLGAACSQ